MRHLAGRAVGPAIMLAVAALAATGCGAAAPPSDATMAALADRRPVPATDAAPLPAVLDVVIQGVALSATQLQAPADRPFEITVDNRDPGIPHGLALQRGAPVDGVALGSDDLFEGEIFAGPASQTYAIPAMAAGVYTVHCLVHPNMVEALVVR